MDKEKEKKILSGILKGNERAFDDFYEEFFPKIYKYAYKRTKSREVAEDLTSETFIKVLKGLPHFEVREYGGLDVWVYKIERNVIRDWFRRNIGRETLPFEEKWEERFFPLLNDPYIMMEASEIRDFVNCALNELPLQYKEIINLRFFERKSIKELAMILNKTEDNVKVLQFRALNALRNRLKEKLQDEK
jgi:RNA polymerase sigma-70 factor (ECF subfamily)